MQKLVAEAHAKINLHLEVLGRRADGYHELRTLMQSIDLADRLAVEAAPAGEIRLSVAPRGAAPDSEENLVVRAALLLKSRVEGSFGARIRLEKRIPAGAGLGGGSADAAAALVALNELWRLSLEPGELMKIGASLGSDIPFFLRGGLAYGVGRGAEVVGLPDLERHWVVVVWPECQIATPEVYARLQAPLTWRAPDGRVGALVAGLTRSVPWGAFRNDLEPVVLEGWSNVRAVFEVVRGTGAVRCGVTGSGAAVFGVYESRPAASRVAEELDGKGVHSVVTETLPQARARVRVTRV